MSFFEMLSAVFIGPLKLVFEIVFAFANKVTGHPGISIVALSIIMNTLLLPLYRRADMVQETSRDVEAKLQKGVAHIKKSFSGDEQMMILQTYYRQNNYKPTDALNGSVSLLLEVPFFMAAYQFLSTLPILQGTALGPIVDLGAPDALISLGGMTINVLPVMMTLINVISSAIYLKGYPMKTKVQLYAMALFFLVFLYSSPSGLVFYWTLNNLFSLGKNLFCKLKNPKKIATIGISAIGLAIGAFTLFAYTGTSVKVKVVLVALSVVTQIPVIVWALRNKLQFSVATADWKPNRKVFILGALLITVLTGLLIPSAVIASSPQEFVDLNYLRNPLWYCVSAVSVSAGTFLVWMGVFYWLASDKGKAIFDRIVWILCGVMIVNYMFFGTDLGILSHTLQYEVPMEFETKAYIINFVVVLAVAAFLYLVMQKFGNAVAAILLVVTIAMGGMCAVNMVTIQKSIANVSNIESDDEFLDFTMSKNGKNVVVIMLDRAIGGYVPYIFNEKPELQEQFDGFTYYSNTISFGGFTNFGVPPIYGGYEYTPVEMNKRDSESLESKHNEALKVLPAIFSSNDFEVSICNAPYVNYQWIPDMSIFDEYPNTNAFSTLGKFSNPEDAKATVANNHRNFFCFSIMKTMPLITQGAIYNWGQYNQVSSTEQSTQVQDGLSVAEGLDASFMDNYNVLCNLPQMTIVTESSQNTLLLVDNEITHRPMILKEPEYIPEYYVDNTEYDAAHQDRFMLNGRQMRVETVDQMAHYHVYMAAMIKLGNWFDYLRENGIYDNTRIIIVSDHGRALGHFDEMLLSSEAGVSYDVEYFNPLLMVKDFNSEGFTTSEEFMTNADVPVLTMETLIENPINPFTGNAINNNEKYAHDQIIIVSSDWDTSYNNGNTFLPARWATVEKDIWDGSNWSFYDSQVVISEHALP